VDHLAGETGLDKSMETMPYFCRMKMTLHIDESLLKRVMAATGVSSKTRAVDLALRELDRRAELKRLAARGLGLTPGELRKTFDPRSDPRTASLSVAEKPARYGRKPRSG